MSADLRRKFLYSLIIALLVYVALALYSDWGQLTSALQEFPWLRLIPVVVLTTSEAEEDIARSYRLQANAYVAKPVDFGQFIRVVRQIDNFFVTVVKLPYQGQRP